MPILRIFNNKMKKIYNMRKFPYKIYYLYFLKYINIIFIFRQKIRLNKRILTSKKSINIGYYEIQFDLSIILIVLHTIIIMFL